MRLRSVVVAAPTPESVAATCAIAADAVCIALDDARHDPQAAREEANLALPRIAKAGKIPLVSVNHPRTGLLRDDLAAVVGGNLRAVILPAVSGPQDLRDLGVGLREFEYARGFEPGSVAVFATIGTPEGLLRAPEIAAATPRVAGLIFDSRAYALAVGGRPDESGARFAYARGAVIAAVRAVGGTPLATADGFDLHGLAGAGFAGVILGDHWMISAANAAFTPARESVDRARRVLAAYAAARAEGALAGRLDGDVVDRPAALLARQVLEQAGVPEHEAVA